MNQEYDTIAPPPPLIPDLEFVETLGIGGMACVYLFKNAKLERHEAVKVISEDLSRSTRFRRRFAEEAKRLAQFEHQNIVGVYDTGFEQRADGLSGRQYIRMAYVRNGNLRQLIDKGELTQNQAAKLARQLAGALAYSHSKGVIHRDVKPHNILITDDFRPVLSDFGVAKSPDSALTVFGAVIGAPRYMAPEQAHPREDSPLTAAADMYSFGLVFFEMLTGTLPPEQQSTVNSKRDAARIRSQLVECNKTYADLICRCLSKNPELRPSASECEQLISKAPPDSSPTSRWQGKRYLVAGTTLLAAIVLAGAFLALPYYRPAQCLDVTPVDAMIHIDGSQRTACDLPGDSESHRFAVTSPGFVGIEIHTSNDALPRIELQPLGEPTREELLTFMAKFFDIAAGSAGAEQTTDVSITHHPLQILSKLDDQAPDASVRADSIRRLANLGDWSASLVQFVASDKNLISVDRLDALNALKNAMNGGYALASFFYALHLVDKAEKPLLLDSAAYTEIQSALDLADKQGLGHIVRTYKESLLRSNEISTGVNRSAQ